MGCRPRGRMAETWRKEVDGGGGDRWSIGRLNPHRPIGGERNLKTRRGSEGGRREERGEIERETGREARGSWEEGRRTAHYKVTWHHEVGSANLRRRFGRVRGGLFSLCVGGDEVTAHVGTGGEDVSTARNASPPMCFHEQFNIVIVMTFLVDLFRD
ncbi:hypothetical protein GW17_00017383 [Ensete ventricosum]|nr:hypothetical protein GW17_00017383 [Ensete ventricosum]